MSGLRLRSRRKNERGNGNLFVTPVRRSAYTWLVCKPCPKLVLRRSYNFGFQKLNTTFQRYDRSSRRRNGHYFQTRLYYYGN